MEFEFRKLRFVEGGAESPGAGSSSSGGPPGGFTKLKYPTKKTFDEYRKSTGFATETAVRAAQARYGTNKFEVPIPSFMELLKEQLLAPFFCFQMFCVALWAIDEYWYYGQP